MALHRQGSGSWQVGIDPFGTALRVQDRTNGDQKSPLGRHPNNSRFTEASSRNAMKPNRGKRLPRSTRFRPCGIGLFIFLLLCVVFVTILGGDYLFSSGRNRKARHASLRAHDFFDNQDHSMLFSLWNRRANGTGSTKDNTTDLGGDVGNGNWNPDDGKERSLQFGNTFVGKEELLDRDSREWDSDDRMRDRSLDYQAKNLGFNEERVELDGGLKFTGSRWDTDAALKRDKHAYRDADTVGKYDSQSHLSKILELKRDQYDTKEVSGRNGGLYSERSEKELQMYAEQLEAASKWESDSKRKNSALNFANGNWYKGENTDGKSMYNKGHEEDSASTTTEKLLSLTGTNIFEEYDTYDVYDDIGDETALVESANTVEEEHSRVQSADEMPGLLEDTQAMSHQEKVLNDTIAAEGIGLTLEMKDGEGLNDLHAQNDTDKGRSQSRQKRHAAQERLSRRTRRRRRAGHPCEMDFLETTRGLNEPETDVRFANFSLKYIETEEPQEGSDWEPRFAGHQTLQQREQSFIATDQIIHCGFVQDTGSFGKTGFDLAQDDHEFLKSCKIAVSSCIFASSDNIRSPRGKKLTGSFKKDVCFVMFVDQQTLDVMKQEGQELDDKGYLGLWKVIVVKNVPYADARRTGKVPKFLTHRLFPAARYSIWLDSKLRLQSDPVLILEYFLWRGGYEYAISNHYDRHCVWEEVQQNKKLNKYNHTVIDEQFAFYQADGLYRFNASDPKKLLPSYVPEGSFIIRAHTPMSNLFSCLWFNEVERFTPRDQLSFAYTYMKLVRSNPDKHFYLNMFKDCERKAIAKLFRHRKNTSSVV